jgi:probable phosphoglycerate mutase
MADPPEVWLIRHGETEWSRAGRHTGRTDVPLTAVGEQEAATLPRRLGGRRFAVVLSSPLARAWQTCRIAGHGEDAERVDDLMEWDYGDYEGRTTAEILVQHPGWVLWTDGAPDGESAEQVGLRATRIIERIAPASGSVALFAHGHLLRVLAACWLGLSPREGRLFALDTASIGVLGHEGGRRIVREWNVPPESPLDR